MVNSDHRTETASSGTDNVLAPRNNPVHAPECDS